MDELLKKLLEADVLNEETKTELEQAFQTKLDEAIEAAKEDASADVRAELTEQWVDERDKLVEAIDTKVTEFLNTELEELKEDIEKFRDLEAEYAEKVVEAKAAMSDELKDDLSQLVEKIDAFLEIRIGSEMEELKEDLEDVRKNEFGRKIFESFAREYIENYADDESAAATLRETEQRLADTEAALAEAEEARGELERGQKLDEILSPLSGRQRDVMEAILSNVDTERLEEGYKTFIGRVIRETEDDSEKESGVLAEGKSEDCDEDDKDSKKKSKKDDDEDDDTDDDDKEEIKEGVAVTGDTENMINEEADPEKAARLEHIRKLAGIK